MDSVRGDPELVTVVLEDDADLPFEVPPSTETVEGVPLHDVEVGTRGHLWKL